MQFSVKRLLIVVTVIACTLGFMRGACIHLTRVETGENVESVDWLPTSATNVSFYRSYSFTAYEFDIPESDFVDWARWNLKPISKPVSVVRYCYSSADVTEPDASATQAEWDAFEQRYDARRATVADGLYYVNEQPDGGGVWVAYDRKQGRAYFHTALR